MAAYPTTVEEAIERLLADMHYRIRMAVENNPDAVMARYASYYADAPGPRLHTASLVTRLQVLWDMGEEDAVQQIIMVPWVTGRDALLDQVMALGQAMVDDNPELLAEATGETGGGGPERFVWVGAALTALAGIVPMIGQGQRNRNAANAEQARINAMAATQAAADAAAAERQKRTLQMVGIGAGALVLIVVLWLILRNR